jgi:hypothetical protein
VVRSWEKYLNETQPDKAKTWAILGRVFDAVVIGLLVLSLFMHSCEICYTTSSISGVAKSCTSTIDVYRSGHPLADRILGIDQRVESNESRLFQDITN